VTRRPWLMYALTCPACGVRFLARDRRRRWCCRTCKDAVWLLLRGRHRNLLAVS